MARCLVIGAGRVAGGFLAPLLSDAGWTPVLAARDSAVRTAITTREGLRLRMVGRERWIGGVAAVPLAADTLDREIAAADLVATAVGPSSLAAVGRLLGPALARRLARGGAPLNVIAFENHRRAGELLAGGIFEAAPALAGQLSRRLGIGGAAVWRTVSRRVLTGGELCLHADALDECHVDASSLLPETAPLDGSLPALSLTHAFDGRMVEKLWLFNGGHAAAAYLGAAAGCATVDEAMRVPAVRALVVRAVDEAADAFAAYVALTPGAPRPAPRPLDSLLERYCDPALADSVARVAREPRRKLAAGDRLIGPAIMALGSGRRPEALAAAAAAALHYRDPDDAQATGLGRELELLGPEEVLAAVSTLDRGDELIRLIAAAWRPQGEWRAAA
jgi:mannitol-1-phosphate 5-dehydrogenase